MNKARYVMIGGFLGAGKTTAILGLARLLASRSLRVGLITNDQSVGLVDSAVLRNGEFAVEEITGGCFCCRFNSLTAAAAKLTDAARPDVFLAEPVGSCTDLSATVALPLRHMYGDRYRVAPLSVLIDPERALRVLGLEAGPAFSPKVEYIYTKQLEEADILVINKPKGLVVHPAPGHAGGTLVNAVLAHAGDELSGIGGEERPGIVHRLDRDTSGLILVAKTDTAHESLQRQIAGRTAERRYLALVRGTPKFERAEVDACIGRHPTDRKRMAVLPSTAHPPPRPALTELTVLERFPGFALLEARLQTGRTHQIRVHCAYIGHPVIGDPVYGPRLKDPHILPDVRRAIEALEGQALHAYRLAFDHPRSGERLTFTAPPPPDTQAFLNALGSRFAIDQTV